MIGWISIDRALLEHNIVGIKKHNGSPNHKNMIFWIWLLTSANYEKTEIFMKGETVIIDRGQFYASLRFMEKGTAFSTKEIRKILKDLKKGTLIDIENVAGQTMITICNYSFYQKNNQIKKDALEIKKGKPRAQQGHSKGTAKGTKYNKVNNNNNINNNLLPGFEDVSIEEEFEIFFKDYGKHGNKKTAKSKFIKIRQTTPLDELTKGNKKYVEHLEIETWKRKKHLVTWLNQDGWKDEYETGGYGSNEEYLNVSENTWKIRVKAFKNTGRWYDEWGPGPDSLKNHIPENILKENNYLEVTK